MFGKLGVFYPIEMKKSSFSFFKKARTTNVTILRGGGVSFLSIAPKLVASVILLRLSETRERRNREEQVSFRSGRKCVGHIFILHQMLKTPSHLLQAKNRCISWHQRRFWFVGHDCVLELFVGDGHSCEAYYHLKGSVNKNFRQNEDIQLPSSTVPIQLWG